MLNEVKVLKHRSASGVSMNFEVFYCWWMIFHENNNVFLIYPDIKKL